MRERFKNRYIAIILVVTAIIGLHYIGALQPIERAWESIISVSGAKTTSFTQSIVFWHGWKEKELLQTEIYSLQNRLQRNESSLARLKSLEKENEELKNTIAWNKTKRVNTVVGKIIGKPINYPNSYIIVNRGEDDGVKTGQPVFINEDILIGKVSSTQSTTAIIQLITDNQSTFSVRKSDEKDAIGLVSGKLGLSLELSFVPITKEILLGDILVTSGLDSLIPEGLILGSVDEINVDESDFFQTGKLALSYNPNELSIISIIVSQ